MQFVKWFQGSSGSIQRSWPPRGPPQPRNSPNEKCETISNTYAEGGDEKDPVLRQLRRRMQMHKVGLYIVTTLDEHNSEFVADEDKRIEFLSNFSGSSAFVVVGVDFAELATDSRYYLIARNQLSEEWRVRELGKPGVKDSITALVDEAASRNVSIGADPKFLSMATASKIRSLLATKAPHLQLVCTTNLVDEIWPNKPSLPDAPIISHALKFTGETAEQKVKYLRSEMLKKGIKSFIMYNLDEVAYTLNLRGGDIPFTPVFKGFLVVSITNVVLYTDCSKMHIFASQAAGNSEKLNDTSLKINCFLHEGLMLEVREYANFFKELSHVEKPAWIPDGASWAIVDGINDSKLINDPSPINRKKAIKNPVEIECMRIAQIRCSLSIVKYLAWLEREVECGNKITESDGARKLLEIRQTLPDFRGLSYEVISAVGPNSSMPHYVPADDSKFEISDKQIYLLDSGSQFLQGSTDITRTVHFGTPTSEEVKAYTLVLKGQIAVSTAIFPKERNASSLDFLARQYLWEEGMDYGHGTGHGIGSYLGIHELPLGIFPTSNNQSNLLPGHFMSVEPGYYKDNDFGIRLENDILTVVHGESNGTQFLTFDTLNKVPYWRKLIDPSLLTRKEVKFINEYHESCWEILCNLTESEYEREWLRKCCSPI